MGFRKDVFQRSGQTCNRCSQVTGQRKPFCNLHGIGPGQDRDESVLYATHLAGLHQGSCGGEAGRSYLADQLSGDRQARLAQLSQRLGNLNQTYRRYRVTQPRLEELDPLGGPQMGQPDRGVQSGLLIVTGQIVAQLLDARGRCTHLTHIKAEIGTVPETAEPRSFHALGIVRPGRPSTSS